MRGQILDRHVRPLPPAAVDRRVSGDPVQESHERQASILVPVERFHRADEDVGYEVLRVRRRAAAGEAIAVDRVPMSLVELPEGGRVAGFRRAYQRGVGVRPRREDGFAESGSPEDLGAPGHLAK